MLVIMRGSICVPFMVRLTGLMKHGFMFYFVLFQTDLV